MDAFLALGGNEDKSGSIDQGMFVKVVKNDFGMTINLNRLIEDLDVDRDGHLSFTEFHALFLYFPSHALILYQIYK